MKLNPRFDIREYVPPQVWKEHGTNSVRFIDRALIDADYELLMDLEEHFGHSVKCHINTWHWGGTRKQCGLRVPGQLYYKPLSLHSTGRASDKIFFYGDDAVAERAGKRIPNGLIYDFILENQATYWSLGIRRMESIRDAKTWIHWDTCWTPDEYQGKLQIVRA